MNFALYKRTVIIAFSAIILWGILSLWGYVSFYNGGSVDDKYAFVVSLFLEVLAFVLLFISPQNLVLRRSIGITITIWLLYTILIVLSTSNNLLMDLRAVLWWPSMYYLACFVFRSKYSYYGISLFKNYFIPVAFITNTALFFYLRSLNSQVGLFASNQVFYVSLLLPCLFLLKKRWMKYVAMLIVVVCASISFKRSTLLVTLLTLFFSLIFEFKGKGKLFTRVLLMALLVGGSFWLFSFINDQTSGYFIERINSINDTGGAGRLDIYKSVLNHFSNQSSFDKLFGSGYNTVIRNGWVRDDGVLVSSHNDFLEILCDYGIVGLVIYIVFIIRLVLNTISIRFNKELFQSNVILLVVFFVMSAVSHLSLYPTYYVYLILIVSLTQASIENKSISFGRL